MGVSESSQNFRRVEIWKNFYFLNPFIGILYLTHKSPLWLLILPINCTTWDGMYSPNTFQPHLNCRQVGTKKLLKLNSTSRREGIIKRVKLGQRQVKTRKHCNYDSVFELQWMKTQVVWYFTDSNILKFGLQQLFQLFRSNSITPGTAIQRAVKNTNKKRLFTFKEGSLPAGCLWGIYSLGVLSSFLSSCSTFAVYFVPSVHEGGRMAYLMVNVCYRCHFSDAEINYDRDTLASLVTWEIVHTF